MTLRLKCEVGRPKLDRSGMLAAHAGLADLADGPAVRGALVARLTIEP